MSNEDAVATELRKIATLLAMKEVADMKKSDAALRLTVAGFSNREIAALIGTSEGSVRGLLSFARKRAAGDEKQSPAEG